MININELREAIQTFGSQAINEDDLNELLDRLAVAEKDIALKEKLIDALGLGLNAVAHERDNLRARIETMERQEPVAWLHETRRDSDVVTNAVKHVWGKAAVGSMAEYSIPLYLAPGALPAPSARITALYPVISLLRNGCDPMKAAVELEMLAAAPEANP